MANVILIFLSQRQRKKFEKIIEITENIKCTTGNLLDYYHFSKLVVIYLTKQIEKPDLRQEINFIGKLEENHGATMYFYHQKIRTNNF